MKTLATAISVILLAGCDPYAAQEEATGQPTFTEIDVRGMAEKVCSAPVEPTSESIERIRSLTNHMREDVNREDLYYAQMFGLCVEWVMNPADPTFLERRTEYFKTFNALNGYDIVHLKGKKTWFKKEFAISGTIVNRQGVDAAPPIVEVTLDIVDTWYGQEVGRKASESFYVDYSDHGLVPSNGTLEFKFQSKTEKGVNGYSLAWCIRGDHVTPYNSSRFRYVAEKDLTCTNRDQAREPTPEEIKNGY